MWLRSQGVLIGEGPGRKWQEGNSGHLAQEEDASLSVLTTGGRSTWEARTEPK